jgi:hypothetical protein
VSGNGNGHTPELVDLGAILEATRPARVLRLPRDAMREDALTAYELVAVGRALGIGPAELTAAVREHGWATVELGQAFAWVILRRVEPALTWEEARTYALDVTPDPTRAASAATAGMSGSSISTDRPGSRRRKRGG